METELDTLSYSLGVSIAANIKGQGMDSISVDAFAKAIKDSYGDSTVISVDEANKNLQEYFQELQKNKVEKAKQGGIDFLAANAKNEGVTTLPSGLQYQIMVEGKGPKPLATSKVTTHYHGTTIDGKVFDSSVERNQPAQFGVNQVIAGWTEALQLMSVGSKWTLFIPSNLAYGERGAGADIPPHAALIFEVELLSIDQ
ncbi:MAG: FKBP-type peptidyl-prolyl cis-trans isomerase [Flavobacteriales bacterium]|nr:FKBP-type peptidyl-prolyl cis-trans isomerase [Flavobacteriales bacterium]